MLKICSPSPVMVTSPIEWKFLELDEKLQTNNQRPMDHIAHLRKPFKLINTYDNIITLIKRRKNPLLSLWESNGSSLNKIKSHLPKDALCQVWLKLAQWFRRGRFFNFVNVFSLFRDYLPLGKGVVYYLNKLEFPSPKNALGQVWLKLPIESGEDFLNFVKAFSLFRNYFPYGKEPGPVLIPFTKGCCVPNVLEIGSMVLEKKIF